MSDVKDRSFYKDMHKIGIGIVEKKKEKKLKLRNSEKRWTEGEKEKINRAYLTHLHITENFFSLCVLVEQNVLLIYASESAYFMRRVRCR